jgi:Mechanosensitive ion channel
MNLAPMAAHAASGTPIDFSNAVKSAERIVNNAIQLLPNFVLAIVVFIILMVLGSLAKRMIERSSKGHLRSGAALLLGRTGQLVMVILGILIALSIAAPSFHASDLIKMLGIGSVAIGFAFQNILQNFLAGILLLLSQPFEIGDLISVTGIEGTVEDIEARATIIRTKEGRKVVIPNATVFTNPVAVERDGKGRRKAPNESGSAPQQAQSGSGFQATGAQGAGGANQASAAQGRENRTSNSAARQDSTDGDQDQRSNASEERGPTREHASNCDGAEGELAERRRK